MPSVVELGSESYAGAGSPSRLDQIPDAIDVKDVGLKTI
jgi:hypothetical protein